MTSGHTTADSEHNAVIADPYREWLGINTVERPPSAYALFNLSELETDTAAIGDAALVVKRTLRSYQIGKYRKQALQLQGEVSKAADILTHPQKKAEYDAQRQTVLLQRAQANFPQADMDRPLDDLFVDWLTACDRVGMPVPQIMPQLMSWCLDRAFNWPQRGNLKVPLPLGLWIYTEVALVGQLVERQPLETRVRAVKAVQQALGVSQALALMVNQHIGRRAKSFGLLPVTQMAANQPRKLMQEWVDRLAARKVNLEPESTPYKAMAFLLGLTGQDGNVIESPVKPQVAVPRKRSRLIAAVRKLRDKSDALATRIRMFAADHPDLTAAMKLAALIAAGIFLLIVVLLIIAG